MNGFGGNNFLWVIILIALLGGCGCGCGSVGGANTDNECSWVIILILLLCCCSNNNSNNNCGCNMCEA